jgi:hypothetical protein
MNVLVDQYFDQRPYDKSGLKGKNKVRNLKKKR